MTESEINRDDARQALSAIESTMSAARHYAATAASPILYVWGAVWFLVFGGGLLALSGQIIKRRWKSTS